MSGFTFNNVSSESMGIVMQRCPERPFPKKKVSAFKIQGRSGDLIVDYGTYENVTQSYDVYVTYDQSETMQKKLQNIATWLFSPNGYAILYDDYDPLTYRYARVSNINDFLNALNLVGYGTINFDCKPQKFIINEPALTGNIGSTFTIPTSDAMAGLPRITVTNTLASTSFTIHDSNGLSIVVPTRGNTIATIIIDYESQSVLNAYNNTVPLNATASGNWKALGNGDTIETTLDSGTTAPSISIAFRRFYL